MKTKEDEKLIIDLMNKSTDKEFAWMKQCLSIIAIILGLLLSLKSKKSINICEYAIFVSAISINALCILSGLIFLYSEHDTLYRLGKKFELYTIRSGERNGGSVPITIVPRKIFGILRKAFFVLLILSILSLIVFGAYSSFPS